MHESMNTGHWWKDTHSGREKWRNETSPATTLSTRYLQWIGLGLNPVLGGGSTVNNNLGHGRAKMLKYTLIHTFFVEIYIRPINCSNILEILP